MAVSTCTKVTKIHHHIFVQRDTILGEGTGLGLAIARQMITEKHGGAIDVKSALNEDTTFVISLPKSI
ncbi:MAG: cell wall metabolism sensor histidine kinase WalK [Goleter apudmare HA4340-LM2]|nr:cell wall metabolism sensor histidine kinase WalK [Goleter apudmare HA4340-LM2]